jgi:uncharacterized protein YjbJ (UPF0337 family)
MIENRRQGMSKTTPACSVDKPVTDNQREDTMNQDQISGKFEQMKGQLKAPWGRLTDDDVALYNGNREKFFGTLQEKYGIEREEAEDRIRELDRSVARNDRAA